MTATLTLNMARRRDILLSEMKNLETGEIASAIEELQDHLRDLDARSESRPDEAGEELEPAEDRELTRRFNKAIRGEGLRDVVDDDALFDELGLP